MFSLYTFPKYRQIQIIEFTFKIIFYLEEIITIMSITITEPKITGKKEKNYCKYICKCVYFVALRIKNPCKEKERASTEAHRQTKNKDHYRFAERAIIRIELPIDVAQ